jgi:GT2 family glycosyltransferase
VRGYVASGLGVTRGLRASVRFERNAGDPDGRNRQCAVGRPEPLKTSPRRPYDAAAASGSGDQAIPLIVSVVVNYRGLVDTRECVNSLLACLYENHSIVIVDNASGSDDADRLAAEFGPRVHVIASDKNLGYGGGANLGLRWALGLQASYVWVLNNDTIIEPGCIGRLADSMVANPGYGILSPQIVAPVGPEAPSGIWFAGGRVLLNRAEARHRTERLDGEGVVNTEYVTGCAMFIRCAALADTGLFWEHLFLYWEDVDLSLRMLRAGWRLGVVPHARIQHMIHGSVTSGIVEYYHFRNALITIRPYATRPATAAAILFLAGGVARRWSRALVRRRSAPIAATRGLIVGLLLTFGRPTKGSDRGT